MKPPAAESLANLMRQTTGATGGATGLGLRFVSSASRSGSGFDEDAISLLAILPAPFAGSSLYYID